MKKQKVSNPNQLCTICNTIKERPNFCCHAIYSEIIHAMGNNNSNNNNAN